MNSEEMVALCNKHTMWTWSAANSVTPIPVERAEGIHFWTPEGKRYIDFNSQLMSVNIGHAHPKVRDAIKKQLDELIFVMPKTATAVRARLGQKLASIVPDPINRFLFTLGGSEANENAIKAARLYTGRHKIITRHRSYHGATHGTMMLTGDPRRWSHEPGMPGVIRVMDPTPYHYEFGKDDATKTAENLKYLEEVMMYEGPHNIAAVFIEPVTGTNGVMPPPKGYLPGLRKLCDKHGILIVCDEVMSGFGRTGKLFAFEHFGIVPDIVTMAKGMTSSYLPLGAMGISDKIAKHFEDNVFWGGLTYNSHPVLLAAAEANIDVMLEEGMIDNAANLHSVMRSEMDRLTEKHPSVKEGRCLGLFGMVDLQKNSAGERMAPYNGTSEAMKALGKAFDERGLFTFVRWGSFMCNPPLCITEEQLLEAYAIIDECLDITDRYFEG